MGDRLQYPIRAHAVLRFWERWRPDLEDRDDVLREMSRLMASSRLTKVAPSWYYPPKDEGRFLRGYLRVNPAVLFCLAYYVGEGVQVSTVLVRSDKVRPMRGPTPSWVKELRAERVDQVIRTVVRRARA